MVNNNGTKDMTVGNTKKVIISFAIPILLSHLFQQLYNTADTLIVGKYLGTESLAAVSSSGPLIFLLISFFNGASMGAGVIIARYFGAQSYEKLSKAIHTNIAVGLLSSGILTAFGVIFTPNILKAMGVANDVLPESIEYFKYYFAGISATIMYNICVSTLNAVGNSVRPLVYLIISSLFNIFLDWLFIGKMHLGIGFAAIATTIASTISVILCVVFLMKKGTVYQLKIKKIAFYKDMIIDMLKYGLPTGVQNSVIGFANVLVQFNIISFGKEAMAACGSYSKIEGFVFLPITCFSMALTTFISQNLGAGKSDRAKQGARFGIVTSVILAEIIGVFTYIFAPNLIKMFDDNQLVVSIGTTQARTVSLFFFLLAFSHCVAGVCRGAGKAFIPMLVMLGIWCVLRITYITIAMKINHKIGLLFWAYPLTWCISSIIFAIYYKRSKWIEGFGN